MATIKKAQKGKKISPTYKNLNMGVENEYYQMSGERRSGITPTSRDSARYRGGFEQGLKGMKGGPNEGQVEKMGRWEGQNAGKPKPKPKPKQKTGGVTKKKMQAGGVEGKSPKAPNKKGAFIDVQNRTLGSMKKGGKVTKRMSKMSKKK